MQKLVCIMTFNQVHETGIARSLLDANGIETFLRNEHLVNTVSLYSLALGGIELQVREEDFAEARQLLIANGLINETDNSRNSFLQQTDILLRKIPFLDALQPVYRLMLTAAVLITVIAVFLFFILKPQLRSAMIDSNWCLKQITYLHNTAAPDNSGIRADEMNCPQTIVILSGSKIVFYGFGSDEINAYWELSGNVFKISSADTLGYKYNGQYIVGFNTDQSELNLSGTSMKMYFKRI